MCSDWNWVKQTKWPKQQLTRDILWHLMETKRQDDWHQTGISFWQTGVGSRWRWVSSCAACSSVLPSQSGATSTPTMSDSWASVWTWDTTTGDGGDEDDANTVWVLGYTEWTCTLSVWLLSFSIPGCSSCSCRNNSSSSSSSASSASACCSNFINTGNTKYALSVTSTIPKDQKHPSSGYQHILTHYTSGLQPRSA